MEKIPPVLQTCPIFDGIRPEDLAGMMTCLGARQIHPRKGDTLFREGDTTRFVGVVLSGAVYLLREDYYGSRSILAHIGPTQIFGEAYAFSGAEALPVSVVAEEDSHILLLDSQRLTTCCTNACEFHNRIIHNLLGLMATGNLMLHRKIRIISRRTTREKLLAYLAHRAKELGTGSFTVPYDRQALADYLEVDRSGLSAEINKLRREGILDCRRSHFRLLKSVTQTQEEVSL